MVFKVNIPGNKLIKLIDTLDHDDLLKVKRDLDEGNLKRILERRLSQVSDENKVCPVCGSDMNNQDFALEFGPPGLRMRAYFDALDCLQHFIKDIEKTH